MTTDEILIETRKMGGILKVTAFHVATGTEVVFQSPTSASPLQIKNLAASKMRYVLEKRQS